MDLGVAVLDLALRVDPEEVVHDPIFASACFVYRGGYVDSVVLGCIAEPIYEC